MEMDPLYQQAFDIIYARHKGIDWDWDRMTWKDPKKPKIPKFPGGGRFPLKGGGRDG